jgi:hypothetical protein
MTNIKWIVPKPFLKNKSAKQSLVVQEKENNSANITESLHVLKPDTIKIVPVLRRDFMLKSEN